MNRHAECTDCHNPHRVTKNRLATDAPSTSATAGTHDHNLTPSNLISGVLRGAWGVEPAYASTAFSSIPTSYTVKKGVPPQNGSSLVTESYVTREYQVCLKCHSDYGFDNANPPALGYYTGGTPSGTNGVTHYTNQAMEFQAPLAHMGEGTTTSSGADPAFETNNHRGWHPVMKPTERTAAIRNMNASNFLAPWNDATGFNVGNQTMYCSDCHGSDTALGTVAPTGGEDGNPWGPHGSNNNFLLKGLWNTDSGTTQADALCFKCHDYNQYGKMDQNPAAYKQSGFRLKLGATLWANCGADGRAEKETNLHLVHAKTFGWIGPPPWTGIRCSWCHTAVPHGWKNKALLANLADCWPRGRSSTRNRN